MTPRKTRLVVSGCCGRMGGLIIEEALKDRSHFELSGAVEHTGHPEIGKPLAGNLTITADLKSALQKADLLIEFTTPEATLQNARVAAESRVPMVIGTTGLTPEQFQTLEKLAQHIPIFWSPNMSIGIVMMRRTIGSLWKLLEDFQLDQSVQIGLSETHHAKKKDKPSGTAKLLAQEIFKTAQRRIDDGDIEAKREGDVVGIHSVTFQGPSEKITLQHEATDRRVFAQGALLVARHFLALWKNPGLYGMDDFLTALQKEKNR